MALHRPRWICEQTHREDCRYCGALPGQPCTCGPGCMHLARYFRACQAQRISAADVAYFIPDTDMFTGATVVADSTAGVA